MKRTAWALAICATVTIWSAALRAQAGQLSPADAQARVVEVRTYRYQRSNTGITTVSTTSAGTLVGVRNDTAYVVTAEHSIQDQAGVYVYIRDQKTFLEAQVRVVNEALDFAVLTVPMPEGRRWRSPAVPRQIREIVYGERVYALGCPENRCWSPPIPGNFDRSVDGRIYVKGLLLESGNSGGPLVDADGALIGIVTQVALPDAYAVDWAAVKGALAADLGFPVDLPEMQAIRVRSMYYKAYVTASPTPGRDSDGAAIVRGFRFEAGVLAAPFAEFVVGFDRVVHPSRSYWYDLPDTYVTPYATVGYRATYRNPFFSVRRGRRDHVTVGFDVLIPLHRSSVVTYIHTDSVDVQYGEDALVRGATRRDTEMGMALRFEYRVGISEHFGLLVNGSRYVETIDDERLSSYDSSRQLQIGVDYRWKL